MGICIVYCIPYNTPVKNISLNKIVINITY